MLHCSPSKLRFVALLSYDDPISFGPFTILIFVAYDPYENCSKSHNRPGRTGYSHCGNPWFILESC